MDQTAFDKGVKRIERLFGQDANVYDKYTLTEIFSAVRHLDADQWDRVVGAVVRSWAYPKTLPSISAFEKQKNGLGDAGRPTRRIRQDCPTCGGYGLRSFIYRHNGRYLEGWCICSCLNGQNFTSPPHATFAKVQRLPDFRAMDRPGAAPHLLEVLNEPAEKPEKNNSKNGQKPGIGSPESENAQDRRQATQEEKTATGAQKTAAAGQRPGSRPESEVGQGAGTLDQAAGTLAGKLNANQDARQGTQETRQDKRAVDMIQSLNDWIKDDDGPDAPP